MYLTEACTSCEIGSPHVSKEKVQKRESLRVSFQPDVSTVFIPSSDDEENEQRWYQAEDYERFRWDECERQDKLLTEKMISRMHESNSNSLEFSIELEMMALPSEEELYGYGFSTSFSSDQDASEETDP